MTKKSIIKKSIFRKLKTAEYESVDINLEIQEEIEWDSVEERMKKTDNITKVLLIDFENTFAQTLQQLKLNKCIASIKTK